jgi:hypothetical protein
MSSIAGLLTVSNAQTNDLVGEYQESILVRNSKGMNAGSTLFGLMSRLKTESADNTEFNWWERDPVRRDIYASASALIGATTITVDDNASSPADVYPILAKGTIIKNARTSEYLRVTADPTSATIAVSRGFGGSTAAAINDNDLFTVITLAKDEGDTATRAVYEEPSLSTNYIQTFNSSVYVTNAFKNGVLRTDIEGPLRERRIQALEKIANDIEYGFLFGKKARTTGSNGYVYTTGGIQNVIDAAGLTDNALNGQGSSGATIANFNLWLQSFMVYGSDAKLAFCGPKAYQVISSFANSEANGFRIMNQETVFGMNITEIVTPFGVLNLAFHPLLKNATDFNDWMVVVDLAHVVQKTYEPLFLEPNIQTPGQDAYQEQFRAKLGMKVKFPQAHGYAYDLQKIVAS